MKTRSKLRTKLSKASTKRSGCLLLSKQTKHKQKQNTQVSTPKVPSQRRSTPLEPNFHKKWPVPMQPFSGFWLDIAGNPSHLRVRLEGPSGIEYEAQPGIRHKTTKEEDGGWEKKVGNTNHKETPQRATAQVVCPDDLCGHFGSPWQPGGAQEETKGTKG